MMGHDWLRFFFTAVLAAYLVYRIEVSTEKLLERKMGSTEVVMSAPELLLPSVTFCMESYGNRTARSNNITADYVKLPGLGAVARRRESDDFSSSEVRER